MSPVAAGLSWRLRGAGRSSMDGRFLAVAALLPILSGCAALVGAPATGPDGLALRDMHLRELVVDGRTSTAYDRVAEGGSTPSDRLLRLQYEGLLAHEAGRYGRSNASLQAAADLAGEHDTRSLTKTALSLLTNDRIMAYRPPAAERLMLHYYGVLNYLSMGDTEGAGVEARRLAHLLSLEADKGGPGGPGERRLHAALRYVTGAAFEAIGEMNDAAVAYRLAHRLDDEGLLPEGRALPDRAAPAGWLGPRTGTGASAQDDRWGEVLVIVEDGFAPHLVERASTLLLWPDEVGTLRAAAAAVRPDPAAEGLALSLARRVLDAKSERPRRSRPDRGGEDGSEKERGPSLPRAVRFAWPAYREATPRSSIIDDAVRLLALPSAASKASAAVRMQPGDPVAWAGDVAGALLEEGRRRQPAIVARAVARAAAKTAIARGIEEGLEEEDEALGELAGSLLSAAGALTEHADTRCWSLLPARIGLVRFRLPAGSRRLLLDVGARRREGARRLDLGEVSVRPGRLTVVKLRHRL